MIQRSFSAKVIFMVIVMLVSVTSCDPTKKLEREEEALILNYVASNPTLPFERKASGLYYLEVQPGPGRTAVTHDTAFVKYTGKFLDGTVFDSNVEKVDTLILPVNEGYVIPGFDEGLLYLKEGGKAMFLIPSYLGFGNSGYIMPSYTPILFDVELVLLKAGPGK